MSASHNSESDYTHTSQANRLDAGLAAAFRSGRQTPSAESVLKILQQHSDVDLGVQLETPEPDDAPVKVTDEAKALRNPDGRYQVLGEIGRGGVGVVYKGRDQDLGRDVAMKVLRDEYATRPDVLARFVEEAQIGGQLQHPGIVPVYELGLQNGKSPYFAMKLVKGETLGAQLSRRKSFADDRNRLLAIFEQVCQTIAYAHSRLVIHRDLKPDNIMIGAFGQVLVVDWGFAKVLSRGSDLDASRAPAVATPENRSVIETVRSGSGSGSASSLDSGTASITGSMFGTPAYMAPEQARGEVLDLDERADVFGLGAILCELLTGSPPYTKEDGNLVKQAAGGKLDPARKRLAECGADEVLVALCLECLSPAKLARPDSAEVLAERIADYHSSVEERARVAQMRAAQARTAQRATLFAAVAGLAVLAVGGGFWWRLDDQAQERNRSAQVRVAAATSAASAALGRAQAAGLDEGLWAAAQLSSDNLMSLADSDDVNAETREAAGELHASVLAESNAAAIKTASDLRDSVMLERLETLRIPLLDQQREGEDFQGNRGRYGRPSDSVWRERELRRIGEDYALAFAEYLGGPSLLTQETEQALLALRSGEIEPALGTALDHWVLARESLKDLGDAPDAAGTQQVRELASALDTSDPWRTQLRDVMSHADGQASKLLALAEQLDLPSLTVSGCRVLAEALSRAGERDAAIRVLQRGRRQHPGSFDLCLSLAMAFQRSSTPDHEAALDLYRVAHALRPDIDQLIRLEGRALQTLGRAGEAQELYRSESQRQPDNSIWLFEIGRILNLQGKQREGMDTLKAALARDPRSIESRILLGDIFRNREEFQAAVVHFRLGLEVDPANIDLTIRLAWACSELGELDEAIENYETYLASNPRDAQNLTNLASALWLQGKISESAIYFEQAIEVNPDYVPALTGLGANPNRRGTDGSKKLLGKAIELNPLHAPAHLHMASQFTMDGRYGEALTYYRQALELWAPLRDPFSVRWAGQTRIILDDCLYQRGRKQAGLESWELAEGALRECLEGRKLVKPEHWQTFDAMSLLGAVMLGQEQFDEAEQLLVEGYLGLDDREASIPAKRKGRMIESIQRLIEFYEAVEDETEVASWQSTLKLAKSK